MNINWRKLQEYCLYCTMMVREEYLPFQNSFTPVYKANFSLAFSDKGYIDFMLFTTCANLDDPFQKYNLILIT